MHRNWQNTNDKPWRNQGHSRSWGTWRGKTLLINWEHRKHRTSTRLALIREDWEAIPWNYLQDSWIWD